MSNIPNLAHPRLSDLLDALAISCDPHLEKLVSVDTYTEIIRLMGETPNQEQIWLCLYILWGRLPESNEVIEAHNEVLITSTTYFLNRLLSEEVQNPTATVEIVQNTVLVDVFHTSQTDLATGIQRVARETTRRWVENFDPLLVTWAKDFTYIRKATTAEQNTALWGGEPTLQAKYSANKIPPLLVPVSCMYLLPELAAEHARTSKLAALADFSRNKSGVIGFDCVPISSSETVADGMPAAFARNLSLVSRMNKIATISDAANDEYSGWAQMLKATGITSPEIRTVSLASEIAKSNSEDESFFREKHKLDSRPLVLVVGSHEPRKNHLAVLRVAERAWIDGLDFQLFFIGGNSWNSERFNSRIYELNSQGFPVNSTSRATDQELYAALSMASFSVFPSWNEGFGLPIAESLEMGTPVITSNYGSMADIAGEQGTILIDPRNEGTILSAFKKLLTDSDFLTQKTEEAKKFIPKTWDTYANELWEYFNG